MSSTALPIEWIERLFVRLSGMYGSKFADLWRGCDLKSVKAIWAEDLASYTSAELRTGIEACKTRTFPPTLPEFMSLCRPPLDYEKSFHEAVEQMAKREAGQDTWSNPAVFWAAARIGNDMQTQPYSAIRGRWAQALDKAIADIKAGTLPGETPQRLTALPAPGRTSTTKEQAQQNIAKIRDLLSGSRLIQPGRCEQNY